MNKKVSLAGKLFCKLKFVCKKIEKIEFIKTGVKNSGDDDIISKLLYQSINQCGFAGANIAGKEKKPLVVQDPVF